MGLEDFDTLDDGDGKSYLLISCSICLNVVTDKGDRSWAKLQCGHQFHLGVDIKCIEKERRALLMIKKDLIDEFGHLSSWDDEECCNWRGIRCNNQTRHVTMLDLRIQNHGPLRGKISPSLFELQHLTYLDLSNNVFIGSHIPDLIGSLTQLRYLNLSHALFGGTIPYQLGNLSSLRSLDLGYNFNRLTSDNLHWLSYLSSLRYVDMSFVDLGKAVDWVQSINMLPSISYLRLMNCSLPSTIPPNISLSTSLSLLDLSLNTLTPKLYHWLFNFVGHSLTDLDLSWNMLEVPIPDAFENMTSLAHLDLSYNQIEGGIPKSLGNLPHIRTLLMSGNFFNGSLPEIVRNLSGDALEILDLGWNRISGSVPDITIFSSLIKLIIWNNKLNGSLPNMFEHPCKIEVLEMSYNQITGSLPDLYVFPRLRELGLSYNQINGSLPQSIGQLSKLERLDVSYNQLQGGTLTEAHFWNVTKLEYLDFSNNHFILELSSKWQPPFQLKKLGLATCKLGPRFPVWLRTQNHIIYLDISNSGISDAIPDWFWDLPYNLSYLNISHNQLKGVVPHFSSNFVKHIDLSSNQLDGPLPLFPSTSTILNLSDNMFNGSISILCAIIGGALRYLDLSDNLLSGHLPDCWWQWEELQVLKLDSNYFSGEIPSSMGSLRSIISLHLRNNHLIGELPSSLQNCTSLVTMDVGENKLSGNLPAWVGEKLSDLVILILHSNEFNGSIPVQLCHLNSVQILDISLNNMTGTIPGCLNNFTAIAQNWSSDETIGIGYYSYSSDDIPSITTVQMSVDSALVSWKGRIFEYRNTLGLVKSIDLSSNKLMGEIPLGITNLSGLVSLNLSRNNLVGLIPRKIGQLRLLQSIDLSRNRLYGEIPESMSDLNFLSHLDLSYNNLSGKIPSGTQLQSLEASSFAGNPALCGPPTTQKCPGDYTNQAPPTTGDGEDANTEEHDDELARDKWFYASIAVGFIVGFWGVCGTLLLHRSWRHAYFQFFDNTKDWIYVNIAVHTTRMRNKFQSCRNNRSQ